MKENPRTPVRADHRFILNLISVMLDGKANPRRGEVEGIARGFRRLGGSWVGLFHGNIKDVSLMKRLIKLAYKHRWLTRKDKWGP